MNARLIKNVLGTCLCALLTLTVQAEETVYQIKSPSLAHGKTKIQLKVPYSLGVHHGEAHEIQGTFSVSNRNFNTLRGSFEVPINSIKTGNPVRDCHLRESLGLNYAVSDFPKKHVCQGDILPESGPNAVAYPLIRFDILESKVIKQYDNGKKIVQVKGIWDIHGRTRWATHRVEIRPTATGGLHAEVRVTHKLSDHDIVVKTAKKLGFTIRVGKEIYTLMSLDFQKNE